MRHLAWMGLLLLCAGGTVRSEEGGAARDAAMWNAARAAMDAQIRLGDLARQRGDLAVAEKAYRAALAIYERTSKRMAAAPFAGPPRKGTIGIGGSKGRAVKKKAATNQKGVFQPAVPPRSRHTKRRRARAGSAAISAALAWLARSQRDDGLWDADKHGGGALFDPGVTGLAILAMLGAGYTDAGQTAYAGNVRKGLSALMKSQDKDGCIGTRASHSFIYNHCIATTALCEAYALTRNPRYKPVATKAANYIMMARNPYMAWRYTPRGGENDTSVTAWAIIALTSAKQAGIKVDPDAFVGARNWVEKMTDPRTGRIGYNFRGGQVARPEGMQDRFPANRSHAMTAAGLLIRACAPEFDPRAADVQRGAKLCLSRPPAWNVRDGSVDMYYWYYGTMAMVQIGGSSLRTWNDHAFQAVLDGQRQRGPERGSWDAMGPWGNDGGRVYATAVMAMTLQVVNRYDKVFYGPRKN